MSGNEPETQSATSSPVPGDQSRALPISSGDFPTITPPPQVMTHTGSFADANHASMPETKPADVIPVRRKIGKYTLIKEIGRGGMGVVYLAHQDDLNRDVALKVISAGPDADPTEVARFHAEAETAANLHHPNIVPVYEVGTSDTVAFLAMEYVDGGSLYKIVARKPMDPMLAARLLEPIARAVYYAHLQGVIHRDLKPSNILITRAKGGTHHVDPKKADTNPVGSEDQTAAHHMEWIPKITDFGLAKRLDRPLALTQTGMAVGTPHYMAPEQALGQAAQISPSTDVYALGAILYEMLTGHPPFGAGSSLETMQQVVSKKPVPPSTLRAGLPAELERICLKCLEKKQSHRFESAQAVADALSDYILRSQPPTIAVRAAKQSSDLAPSIPFQGAWYVWPLVVLLGMVLTGFFTWKSMRQQMTTVTVELMHERQLLEETTAQLKLENALILADRGDFDRVPNDQESFVQAYRKFVLEEIPWENPPRTKRMIFDHSGQYILSLGGLKFDVLDAGTNQPLSSTVVTTAGKQTGQPFFGRAKNSSVFAFVAEPTKLVLRADTTKPSVGRTLNFDQPISLVQPLGDGSAILVTDGQRRWRVDLKNSAAEPVLLPTLDPSVQRVLAVSERGQWLVETNLGWQFLADSLEATPVIPALRAVAEVQFSPTQSHLLAIMQNGALKLFDLFDQRWIDLPADGIATSATFSNDGNLLLVGTRAGTVRLWDVHSRTSLSSAVNLNHAIISVDLSPDGKSILAITDEQIAHRFRFNAQPHYAPSIRLLNKPFKDVVDIAFSSGGESLYVTTPRGLSRWTIKTAQRQRPTGDEELVPTSENMVSTRKERRVPEFKAMAVREPSGQENSEQVLLGGVDGESVLFNMKTTGPIPAGKSSMDGDDVTGVVFGENGRTLTVANSNSQEEAFVHYWKANFGIDPKRKSKFGFRITAECFTPDGQHVVFGTERGLLKVWDPEKSTQEFELEINCESRVICVAVSRDRLLAGLANGEARIYDRSDGKLLRVLNHRTEVREVAFHGHRPITATADGSIRVWDATQPFTMGPPFRHADAITALAIRGNLLATASRDRTIRVWNLP